jgi:hypothetical protein
MAAELSTTARPEHRVQPERRQQGVQAGLRRQTGQARVRDHLRNQQASDGEPSDRIPGQPRLAILGRGSPCHSPRKSRSRSARRSGRPSAPCGTVPQCEGASDIPVPQSGCRTSSHGGGGVARCARRLHLVDAAWFGIGGRLYVTTFTVVVASMARTCGGCGSCSRCRGAGGRAVCRGGSGARSGRLRESGQ